MAEEWKKVRDAVLETFKMASEQFPVGDVDAMMLLAKLHVKLKNMNTEAEWAAFNTHCARVNIEMQKETLRRLIAG